MHATQPDVRWQPAFIEPARDAAQYLGGTRARLIAAAGGSGGVTLDEVQQLAAQAVLLGVDPATGPPCPLRPCAAPRSPASCACPQPSALPTDRARPAAPHAVRQSRDLPRSRLTVVMRNAATSLLTSPAHKIPCDPCMTHDFLRGVWWWWWWWCIERMCMMP